MPNVELIQKVLDHITAHPDEWDQENWATKRIGSVCGTAYCFAGHAVLMAGYDINWGEYNSGWTSAQLTNGIFISSAAQYELGLTEEQADDLFYHQNTLSDLYAHAHKFTDGAIEIPDAYKFDE